MIVNRSIQRALAELERLFALFTRKSCEAILEVETAPSSGRVTIPQEVPS